MKRQRCCNGGYADGSTRRTDYDRDSNVNSVTDNNGLVSRFTYDPLARVTKVQIDKGTLNPQFTVEGTTTVLWEYDDAARTVHSKSDFCSCMRHYDSLQRTIQETQTLSSALSDTNQEQAIKRTF